MRKQLLKRQGRKQASKQANKQIASLSFFFSCNYQQQQHDDSNAIMNVATYFPVLEAKKRSKKSTFTPHIGLQSQDITLFNLPAPFYLQKFKKAKKSPIGPSTLKKDGTILSSAATSNQLEDIYREEKKEKEINTATSQIKPCDTAIAKAANDICDIKVKKLKRSLQTIFD